MNLKNKRILITGATGGIGNSLVKKFNDLGSKILATGTNDNKLCTRLSIYTGITYGFAITDKNVVSTR